MNVNIRCVDGTTFTVTVDSEATVKDVKDAIEREKTWSASTLRLVFRGKVLQDEKTLTEYCEWFSLQLLQGAAPVRSGTSRAGPRRSLANSGCESPSPSPLQTGPQLSRRTTRCISCAPAQLLLAPTQVGPARARLAWLPSRPEEVQLLLGAGAWQASRPT